MAMILIAVYAVLLSFILLYSFVQLSMLISYWRKRKKVVVSKSMTHYPLVTIQLPIYNERYVIERLINKVCALDYPKDKMQIQVLDDSSDNTLEIVRKIVEEKQLEGFDIQQVLRVERSGFKAGALKYGMGEANGEFVAIFDADFMPQADFLKQVVPHFSDAAVGMVQTRWGHLNKDFSLLTRLQAFGLDAHFSVEQVGRNNAGHFINFNGTAGVWRKECIQDAGSWESDTLTEDLDLSYRAQVKGWKFKYLQEVETPAELPVNIYPLKSQQFRWTKGAAECFRKNLSRVWKSDLPFITKLHAFFHLSNSFLFVAILLSALISVPLLYIKISTDEYDLFYRLGAVFLISFIVLVMVYYTSFKYTNEGDRKFGLYFPLFLSVSMGLSLHNSIAVLEGFFGKKTPFIRTPKFNSIGKSVQEEGLSHYVKSAISPLIFVEFLLAIYFSVASIYGAVNYEFGLLPFHLMLSFGFFFVSVSAIKYHLMKGNVFFKG
jgi:cellulose synthase/poly-beta-1,6-N-acetylglucosamine synthase-like glycosyltransferase